MNYLAINTAVNNEILLSFSGIDYYKSLPEKTKTSEMLLPMVNDLLTKSGKTISDIDVLACVVGPGSFTGIRIGVSTARALAYALDKPIVAVTYFDCLAYNNTAPFSAVVDGGDGKVCYIQNFDQKSSPPKAIWLKDLSANAHKIIVADNNLKTDLQVKRYKSGQPLLKAAVEKAIEKKAVLILF